MKCVFFAVQVKYSSKKGKAHFPLLTVSLRTTNHSPLSGLYRIDVSEQSGQRPEHNPLHCLHWFDRITQTAFTGICLFVASIYTCTFKTWDTRRCTEYISVKHKKYETKKFLAMRHNCGPRWLYILIKLTQQSIIFRVNFPCSSSVVKYTHRWGGCLDPKL